MANAIKHISVERGYDVTEYTLCCFGGAGGQHACLVADALGMTRVLLHPLAGVLSAYGMGLADVRALRQQALEMVLSDATLEKAATTLAPLEDGGARRRRRAGHRRRRASAQGARSTSSTRAPTRRWRRVSDNVAGVVAEFERKYRQQYGFLMPGKPLVVEAIAVEAIGRTHDAKDSVPAHEPRARPLAPIRTNRIYTDGAFRDAAVYDRLHLRPGDAVAGPAVIREDNATTVVEPGWRAIYTERGDLVLERSRSGAARACDRHDRRSRSCSKSSTTSSWRSPSRWASRSPTPRTRSTSRNGSISPARCSTPKAISSPTRRTCPCTWARWARA